METPNENMSIDPADYWMTPDEERKLEDKLAEPLTMLPPLPKKEILKAPERREILGYTAAQMMDYANAAVSATWATENHRLRIALHEAINRPKGIVPHEAEEFYDQDFYSTTTAQ